MTSLGQVGENLGNFLLVGLDVALQVWVEVEQEQLNHGWVGGGGGGGGGGGDDASS